MTLALAEAVPLLAAAILGAGLVLLAIAVRRGFSAAFTRARAAPADARRGPVVGSAPDAILEHLPDPVVLRDREGRILRANAAWSELVEGGAGRPASPPRFLDEPMSTETGTRWFSWAETEVELGGRAHTLRSGREVTDRVEAFRELEAARAKAEAASEAKSRFLATVSHEFRTPLNGILGMSGLLLETDLDAEQKTYVQAVRSSAQAFLAFVDDVLDFSKIEAGRIELAIAPFDLPAVVQGVVELLAPRAQGKGIEIASFVAADVPRIVAGDVDRVRQVLFNLAGNAVKFTQSGGVGVSVERGAGDAVSLLVTDTGPGIAATHAQRIFDEFEQADPAGSGDGTGLGLAITRELVQRMGGSIELDSVVGVGSRFRVELALPAAGPELAGAGGAAAAGKRVLVLSNSRFEGPYLARILEEAGAQAWLAATLEQGLDLAERNGVDVLIADLALPDGDVRVASREARRRGIGRSIVLLSPFQRRDFGSPSAAGFDAYLIKPVRARSLLEQLRPAPATARSGPEPTGWAPRLPRQAPHVLLAEDNEVNAILAVRSLERLGALVDWARDGYEALARAERSLMGEGRPFDLVLMDVRMPGLDGFEVTRRIRAAESRAGLARRMRIVALTASVVGNGRAMVEAAGFDALMMKPFTPEALAAEVRPEAPLAAAS